MTAGCDLRSDAARNRASLVVAAREVFGERGLDAPLDEIARRAGVGNATLYRRFPTRQGLIDRMAATAPDAWERVAAFVLDGLQAHAATPAPEPPAAHLVRAAMAAAGGACAG